MKSMALMPKDIKFGFFLSRPSVSFFFSGRLKLKLVDCSFYYRSLVLVAAVAIFRMKLLKLLGNHSIDLVACTIFNTKLLVNCMVAWLFLRKKVHFGSLESGKPGEVGLEKSCRFGKRLVTCYIFQCYRYLVACTTECSALFLSTSYVVFAMTCSVLMSLLFFQNVLALVMN